MKRVLYNMLVRIKIEIATRQVDISCRGIPAVPGRIVEEEVIKNIRFVARRDTGITSMACSWRGNPCLRLKWGCRMLLRNPCQSIDVNGSRSEIPQSGAKKDRIGLRVHFRSACDL